MNLVEAMFKIKEMNDNRDTLTLHQWCALHGVSLHLYSPCGCPHPSINVDGSWCINLESSLEPEELMEQGMAELRSLMVRQCLNFNVSPKVKKQ